MSKHPGQPGAGANRLARETSPYLLLHAANPVDWYPWGAEALDRARREDKPIFLSVGYSTCYWCHVMERECFSNPEIARALNEGFVAIKVDREERPDLDEIYMSATQLLTRSGGWPNSVFLTPELKPFFAGTYFPPRDAMGRPGFPRVLQSLREAWALRRAEVVSQAEVVAQAMREHLQGSTDASGPLDPASVDALTRALASRFDATWGGFGRAPKFPSPSNLAFLLERAEHGDGEAREMFVATLDHMARGGLHDQVAGGFHRYSVDQQWLVPHFEKMLYDNAALAPLYAAGDALAPGRGFARVARETLRFVLAEMTGPQGGFLSAIDAETDGHEGAYYTWTREELRAALGPEDDALLADVLGFDGPPNFERTRYVLHLPTALPEAAARKGMSEDDLLRGLERGRAALLRARGARERLGGPGVPLRHVFREGEARIEAFLDDYAFLVDGLLALHVASGEGRWLDEAARLQAEQDARLGDPGGGYFAAAEAGDLLLRAKPAFDGAVASGNGVSVLNLLELHRLTRRSGYRDAAEATLTAFGRDIGQAPLAHVTLTRGLARLNAPPSPFQSAAVALGVPAAPTAATPAPAAGPPAGRPTSPRPSTPVADLEDEAREVVEVDGRLGPGPEDVRPFSVELRIRRGFHLYANPSGDAAVPPTRLEAVLGRLVEIRYPEGTGVAGGPRTYEGRITLEGQVAMPRFGAPSLELHYQACDETRCLPEVSRLVRLD